MTTETMIRTIGADNKPFTQDEARAYIEYVGRLLSNASFMMAELFTDPKTGPQAIELVHKTFGNLSNYCIVATIGANTPETNKALDIHAKVLSEMTVLQSSFVTDKLYESYAALAALDPSELFEEIQEVDVSNIGGMNKMAGMKGASVKPAKLIAPIMERGLTASGSAEAFCEHQKAFYDGLTDDIKQDIKQGRCVAGAFILLGGVARAMSSVTDITLSSFVALSSLIMGETIRDVMFSPTFAIANFDSERSAKSMTEHMCKRINGSLAVAKNVGERSSGGSSFDQALFASGTVH